jgi:hypothetical protein
MQYPLDIDILRKILPESLERFWDKVMEMAIYSTGLQMDKTLGGSNKNRIGVFGPYSDWGKPMLDLIARTVCKNGYIAVTGYGAYVPSDCGQVIPSKDYLPPIIDRFVETFEVPEFIRFQYFPRLNHRAINLLEPIRTQRNEAEGCYRFSIPMLGIVVHEDVGKIQSNLCNHLVDYKAYQECICPEKKLCLYESLKPHCPFYDCANITWATKQLFMTGWNRLVAINDASGIEPVVTEYIVSKMVKPILSEKNQDLQPKTQ